MSIPILRVYDDDGNEIPIPAIVGPPGADGKSAYESAQDGGYTGTEAQFNTDLAAVSVKYSKPSSGIPKTDLASAVQTSLGRADTALQSHQDISGKLNANGDGSNVTAAFTQAGTRANIATGEKLSVIFGKIAKWFADLKTVAFTGSYNDLSNKPTIPTVPTNVSAFTNDAGYLTSHQSLSAYRTAAAQDTIDSGKQAKITASGVLQGNGNGGVTAKTVDSTPTASSQNLVTSGGVATALDTKQDKPTVKTAMDSVAAVNTQYFLGTQSAVSIVLPSNAAVGQEILVCFSSGSTAASLTCGLTGFDFTPKANKTSWIKFTCCNSSGDWLVETKEG